MSWTAFRRRAASPDHDEIAPDPSSTPESSTSRLTGSADFVARFKALLAA